MSRQQNRKNWAKKKVFEYWLDRVEDLGELPEGICEIFEGECFACGSARRLEICHIIPLVWGGEDSLSNVHILCSSCHLESEGLRLYWNWIKYKRKHEYVCRSMRFIKMMERCGIEDDIHEELMKKYNFDFKKIYEVIRSKMYFTVENYR